MGTSLAEMLHGTPSAQIAKFAGVGGAEGSGTGPTQPNPAVEVSPTIASAHADYLEKQASQLEEAIAVLRALPKVAGLDDPAPAVPTDLAELRNPPPPADQVLSAVRRALGKE